MPNTEITVSKEWDESDPGVVATTDEESVAAVQLDPGEPVSVLVPPVPVRASPTQSGSISRSSVTDLFSDAPLTLQQQFALSDWEPELASCTDWLDPHQSSSHHTLGILMAASGQVQRVVDIEGPVESCLADRIRKQKGVPGSPHLYRITWVLRPTPGAQLKTSVQSVPLGAEYLVKSHVDSAKLRARECIISRKDSPDPLVLHWSAKKGQIIDIRLAKLAYEGWSQRELSCIERGFASTNKATTDAEGAIRVRVKPAMDREKTASSGTFRTAWELKVSAKGGSTTVVVGVGRVPDLRLRPDKPILSPGDPVQISVMRGPDYRGKLPDDATEVEVKRGNKVVSKLVWNAKEKVLAGVLPNDPLLTGLLTVNMAGSRAILWVPPVDPLTLTLSTDRPSYKPGDRARIDVKTMAGAVPNKASVSLFGVDESLGQLRPLLGPDDFARVTTQAKTTGSAFGLFDARSLLSGQIRGGNATLATLLRLSTIPKYDDAAIPQSINAHSAFDPSMALHNTFYEILFEAREAVGNWEQSAKTDAIFTPEQMIEIWNSTLTIRQKRGESYADAFGIKLHLHRLPDHLLELVDPRVMIRDARHLPEDVEDWTRFVFGRQP